MYTGFRQNAKIRVLQERILKVWHLSETPGIYKRKQYITYNSKQESNFSACDVKENNSRLQITTLSKCSANRQSMTVLLINKLMVLIFV